LTDVDKAIGANVAAIVKDGSTIQLGIGAVPDAVAMAFMEKKNLGVHTEMVTSSIAAWLRQVSLTAQKTCTRQNQRLLRKRLRALYDFMDENPSIYMIPWPMSMIRGLSPRTTTWSPSTPALRSTLSVQISPSPSAPASSPAPVAKTTLRRRHPRQERYVHHCDGLCGTKKDGTTFSKIKSMLTRAPLSP
jgi:hypothetical protein